MMTVKNVKNINDAIKIRIFHDEDKIFKVEDFEDNIELIINDSDNNLFVTINYFNSDKQIISMETYYIIKYASVYYSFNDLDDTNNYNLTTDFLSYTNNENLERKTEIIKMITSLIDKYKKMI